MRDNVYLFSVKYSANEVFGLNGTITTFVYNNNNNNNNKKKKKKKKKNNNLKNTQQIFVHLACGYG